VSFYEETNVNDLQVMP